MNTHQTAGATPPHNYIFDQHGRPTRLRFVNDLQGANALRHRYKSLPRRDPNSDATIFEVASDEEHHVADLVHAFYDTNNCLDNASFDGIRYCTRGHAYAYQPDEVEAACRILFHAVLNQCQFGFHGQIDNDRLAGKRRGTAVKQVNDEDMSGSCELRVKNVVLALREWKSICVEIATSDDKILNLANAPATHRRDKQTQKKANTQKSVTQKKRKQAEQDLEKSRSAGSRSVPPTSRASSSADQGTVLTKTTLSKSKKRGTKMQQLAVTGTQLPLTVATSSMPHTMPTSSRVPAAESLRNASLTRIVQGDPSQSTDSGDVLRRAPSFSPYLGATDAAFSDHDENCIDIAQGYTSIGSHYNNLASKGKQPATDRFSEAEASRTYLEPFIAEILNQSAMAAEQAVGLSRMLPTTLPKCSPAADLHTTEEQCYGSIEESNETTHHHNSPWGDNYQSSSLDDFNSFAGSEYSNVSCDRNAMQFDEISNMTQVSDKPFNRTDCFSACNEVGQSFVPSEHVTRQFPQNQLCQGGLIKRGAGWEGVQTSSVLTPGVKRARGADLFESVYLAEPASKRNKTGAFEGAFEGASSSEEFHDFDSYFGFDFNDNNDLFGDRSNGPAASATPAPHDEKNGEDIDAEGEDDDDDYGRN